MKAKSTPLTLRDLRHAIGCLIIGACIAVGIFCISLGIFYNRELQTIADKIDKTEVKKLPDYGF